MLEALFRVIWDATLFTSIIVLSFALVILILAVIGGSILKADEALSKKRRRF